MPASRTARRGLAEKACNECQRRKTRCIPSEDDSRCAFCQRAGKACVFEKPPARTPLTRQNLDQAEARCRQLEEVLTRREAEMYSNHANGGENPQQPAHKAHAADHHAGEGNADYEWNEASDHEAREQSSDSDHARDGMAALTSRNAGSGYLGTSSGHELLQSVSSFLPPATGAGRRSKSAAQETPNSNASGHGLPPSSYASSLSASSIQEVLISAYFTRYNSSYPILNEKSFRDQCASRKSLPRSSSWHITYYAVLAMGEWLSGSGADDSPSLYYEAARSLLKPEVLESGSINNVQAFLILGNYLQKTDRPNTGYNYLGIALRLAMGIGLHRELPSTSTAGPSKRHRRRILFWVLYCFDSWFNITTGRPSLLSDATFDVRMPHNAEEGSVDEAGRMSDAAAPTTCSVIIALARLTKIANKVYNELICAGSCPDVDHQTVVMEHMIQNWQAALPAYMTMTHHVPSWFVGPRQTVYWKSANLRILLLLSSQRHRTDDFEKLAVGSRCQSVAASSINDIATFCDQYPDHLHSGLAWYAVYFTLQAMLSFTSQCVYRRRIDQQPGADAQYYEHTASQAVNCIEGLQAKNAAAGRAYRIVHRLRDVVRQTSGAIPLDASLQAGVNAYGVQGAGDERALQQNLDPQDPPTDPGSIPLDFHQAIPNLVLAEWGNAADLSLLPFFTGMDDFEAGDLYGAV
ncbi:unnamed protein product [Zymoseptoria tritici ST99CH_3D1]|uniref:Zn(2)-C6 fungal-type domain-containing protein n=1 Tax=Zymoseptoria tritici ST99CH_1E4 TaxID=1276532 RepID=A0A2H1FZ67_ZYMTR|nr:unnamed protein product [Zymoseptoria tritici ST99CH_1E4]SMR47824.1 unnamed protein product [Zymoseptoria tritici ST99CH_3D1]